MTALNSQYEKFRFTIKYGRLSKWLNYAKESRGIKQKEVRVVPAQCSLLFITGLLEPVGLVPPPPILGRSAYFPQKSTISIFRG